MSRISLMTVAAAVAACLVGCAQCDTCDDFPAPCTGPNCGQNQPGILDYLPPGPGQPFGSGAPASTMTTPAPNPANDTAAPAPATPAESTTPPTPEVNPGTPPATPEPSGRP